MAFLLSVLLFLWTFSCQEKFYPDLVYLGETSIATIKYNVEWVGLVTNSGSPDISKPPDNKGAAKPGTSTKTLTVSPTCTNAAQKNQPKKSEKVQPGKSVPTTNPKSTSPVIPPKTATTSSIGCTNTRFTTRVLLEGDPIYTTVPYTTLSETRNLISYSFKTNKHTTTVTTVISCIEAIPISSETVVPLLVKNCLHVDKMLTKTVTRIGVLRAETVGHRKPEKIIEHKDFLTQGQKSKEEYVKGHRHHLSKPPPFKDQMKHDCVDSQEGIYPPPFSNIELEDKKSNVKTDHPPFKVSKPDDSKESKHICSTAECMVKQDVK